MFIHHLEPQLKECHMFNPYPEPQLKEHSSKSIFKVSPKPCRSRTSKTHNDSASVLSPSVAPKLAGENQLQIAQQNTYAARCQASQQVSHGEMTLSARHHASQQPPRIVVIAWRVKPHHQAPHQYSCNTGLDTTEPFSTFSNHCIPT